jgi:HEAT repeat protein
VEQVPVRGSSLGALIEIDPTAAEAAMPTVIALLRARENSDPGLLAVFRLGPAGARLLIEYLDDPSAEVRETLVEVLAGFGADSAPALAAGLRHPNPRVREGVLLALGWAPGRNVVGDRVVLARLSDNDPLVRLAAAEALVATNSKAVGEAVPVLVEVSFDRSSAVRARALDRLRRLEQTARPAVPAMLRRVREGDLATRFAAAQVLAAADRSTWRTYVPVYVEVMRTGSEYDRRQAASHLSAAGPVALAAVPDLRGMFDDDNTMNRITAAEAVARIAPYDAADAIAVLVESLDTADPDIRNRNTHSLAAIYALQRIGRPARPAVPALLDYMRYRADTRFGADAALTAIKLDPDKAGPAYDEFRAQLQTNIREPNTRWLDTLSGLGDAAKPLLPDLIAALKSKHEAQREAALATLKELGPAAAQALPALREMAKEKRGGERVNEAIKAIEADR